MSCSFKENNILRIFLKQKDKTTTAFLHTKERNNEKSNLGDRMFNTETQKILKSSQIKCASEELITSPEATEGTEFFSWCKPEHLCGSSAPSLACWFCACRPKLQKTISKVHPLCTNDTMSKWDIFIRDPNSDCILLTSVSLHKHNLLFHTYTVTSAS